MHAMLCHRMRKIAQIVRLKSQEIALGGVRSPSRSILDLSHHSTLVIMPRTQSGVQKWQWLMYRLVILIDMIEKAMKQRRAPTFMEDRFCLTASMLQAMDAEIIYTPATYPICRTQAQAYPEKLHLCDHPMHSVYKHGNANGRYRECRECGARWKVESVRNPISKAMVDVLVELEPRPAPGKPLRPVDPTQEKGQPKRKAKAKAQPKAAAEAESSTRPSGYSSSSARPSPAATTPLPSTRPTRCAPAPPIPVNLSESEHSTAEESWAEEMEADVM